MKFSTQLRRSYRQYLTYGIGHDLTPHEKKLWISMLYICFATMTYYQVKDMLRTIEHGEYSILDAFKRFADPDHHDDELDIPEFVLRDQEEHPTFTT